MSGRKPSARRAPDRRFIMSCYRTVRNRETSLFTDKPSLLTRISAGPRLLIGAAFVCKPAVFARAGRRLLIGGALAVVAAALIVVAPGPQAPSSASAATRPPARWTALEWAVRQAGKWYCWGGTGPSCYDCSGLVMEAYDHVGIHLPRTTYEMLRSRLLRRIPASERRPGDLAFYGSGHVELVTPRGTFGALHTGTRIGWHFPNQWWHPTMYFEVR
jgi:cell wall-associated NlpC family hydrolase